MTVYALFVAEAMVLLTCFVASSYLLLRVDPEVYLLEDGGLLNIAIVVASIMLGLYFQDMYSQLRVGSRTLLAQQICTALGVAFLIQALVNFVNPNSVVPRSLMLLGSVLGLVCGFTLRLAYGYLVSGALGLRRMLLVGWNDTARQIVRRVREHPELGMSVVGVVTDTLPRAGEPFDAPLMGGWNDLLDVAGRVQPDHIVVAPPLPRHAKALEHLFDLKLSGVVVEDAEQAYQHTHNRIPLREWKPTQYWSTYRADYHDALVSQLLIILLLVALAPVFALIALAIKLTSTGPVLTADRRTGLLGEPFRRFLFRTTTDSGAVTSIGRWLRRSRLDGLPQLINVARGEMNLVGPRPEAPEFFGVLCEQVPPFRYLQVVRPGVTGWASINRKFGNPVEDSLTRLEYDLYYILHRSLTLDLYILIQSCKVLFRNPGR